MPRVSEQDNRPRQWAGPLFALALAAVPLAILLYKLPRYGLNFPYWDEMLIAPLIERAKTGQLGFIDLWAQHNEHRPLFPRLIMLALALPTHWNVNWILAANLLCGLGTFAALAWTALRTKCGWWVIPVLGFFVLSWGQMENWVWGLELTVFLCTLAVTLGVSALANARWSWLGFALAIALGWVAAYSFANGLLYWFAAIPALFVMQRQPREQRILRVVLWCAAAFLCIESYFVAYHKPGVSPPLTAVLHHPLEYLGYVLLYLGSPVVAIFSTPPWHGGPPHPYGPLHFVPGALASVLFLGLLWRLWRGGRAAFEETAPWLGIAAFAVGSALVTGVGRVGFGVAEGLNSRYMTTNALFWCALAGLAAVHFKHHPVTLPPRTRRIAALAGAMAVLLANVSVVLQNRPWEENAKWKRMGWQAIVAGYEGRLYLNDLSWDPQALQAQYLPILKKYHLSGFGQAQPHPVDLAQDYADEARGFIARNMWAPALTYLKTAIMLNPGCQDAAALLSQVPPEFVARFDAYEKGTEPEATPQTPPRKP